MDSIDNAVMENVANAMRHLDSDTMGDVHTVLVELNGQAGYCQVTISSTKAKPLVIYV